MTNAFLIGGLAIFGILWNACTVPLALESGNPVIAGIMVGVNVMLIGIGLKASATIA